MEVPEGIYKSMTQVGACLRCAKQRDLRYGVCFECADHVDGEKVPGGHRLWDRDNPINAWFVSEAAH